MFGISFGECLVVLVVALFVLGPEKLIVVTRFLGKGWMKTQQLWHTVQKSL